jgi:hypothetical protein
MQCGTRTRTSPALRSRDTVHYPAPPAHYTPTPEGPRPTRHTRASGSTGRVSAPPPRVVGTWYQCWYQSVLSGSRSLSLGGIASRRSQAQHHGPTHHRAHTDLADGQCTEICTLASDATAASSCSGSNCGADGIKRTRRPHRCLFWLWMFLACPARIRRSGEKDSWPARYRTHCDGWLCRWSCWRQELKGLLP